MKTVNVFTDLFANSSFGCILTRSVSAQGCVILDNTPAVLEGETPCSTVHLLAVLSAGSISAGQGD